MAIIKTESGCKVGWVTYDNLEEAKARGKKEREIEGPRMAALGYDFGYQCPGDVIQKRVDGELVEEWRVTTV